MSQYTVLCVDTEDAVDELRTPIAATERLTPLVRHTAEGAVDAVTQGGVDCLVTGYDLDDETGIELIEAVQEVDAHVPSVLCTTVSPTEIDTGSITLVGIEYVNRAEPDVLGRLGAIVEDIITHNAQAGFLLPEDEQSRLDALAEYDVDSLSIQESFDRLTGLMTRHFDVSVAFIGLIDRTTEEIVACTGADWTQLKREDTVCTHSMLQDDVMVVEDITEDARFASNETLQRLGIVSYAGANLTTPGGNTIGQLCLIAYEPRTYSEDETDDLQEFADLAMEILTLRQQVNTPTDGDQP